MIVLSLIILDVPPRSHPTYLFTNLTWVLSVGFSLTNRASISPSIERHTQWDPGEGLGYEKGMPY